VKNTPCVWWLACLLLILVSLGQAQDLGEAAVVEIGQSEMTYFLGQQDVAKVAGCQLRGQLDELQQKYAVDPNAGLRDQIREREAFTAKLQSLRNEAQRFTSPPLLPTFDWDVRDAQESTNKLKAELNTRLRAPNPERTALKSQIDRLQLEIELNTKLARTLAEKIKSIQEDHRREGEVSGFDALAAGHPDPDKVKK